MGSGYIKEISKRNEYLFGVISILLHIFLFYFLYLYIIIFYLSDLIASFFLGDGLNILSSNPPPTTTLPRHYLKVIKCRGVFWFLKNGISKNNGIWGPVKENFR
jgi:hypothetical protein